MTIYSTVVNEPVLVSSNAFKHEVAQNIVVLVRFGNFYKGPMVTYDFSPEK